MKIFQLFLLIITVVYSTALLTVEVMLHSYVNPFSLDCEGNICDVVFGPECDNIFQFCLREVGGACLMDPITSDDISEDDFTFGADELERLEISNPLLFPNISPSSELELLVVINDDDTAIGNPPDFVDQIAIPFDRQQRADATFSTPTSYRGECGRADIVVSINITSLCPTNTFGPQCNRTCEERPNQNTCNYLGERECLNNYAPEECDDCLTGFQAPGCETCAPDYYPPNICDVFCQPRNDNECHFTCNPSSGAMECLPMYTDLSNCCGSCIGNFREPNCTQCDPNYYPQGTCNTFCLARNDSGGHYTCDPETGDKICLTGYEDPATNCTRASISNTVTVSPSTTSAPPTMEETNTTLPVIVSVSLVGLFIVALITLTIAVVVCLRVKRNNKKNEHIYATVVKQQQNTIRPTSNDAYGSRNDLQSDPTITNLRNVDTVTTVVWDFGNGTLRASNRSVRTIATNSVNEERNYA